MALTKANQRLAARKMAVNTAFFWFFILFETLMASLMGDLTMWLGVLAGHAAILAALAAFLWPFYLVVKEKRDRSQRTV